jgi:hypothetical protein
MAKEMRQIVVHPKRVLIKITQDEWNELFSIWVTRADGSRVQLFTDVEEEEGFERRFRQNVSVGTVLAAGDMVKGVMKGDIAIIDYMVTGSDDAFVGVHNGNRVVSVMAHTTYHEKDSAPMLDGRKTWKKGDIDFLSTLLGVVRMGKLKAFHPYVFLKYENPKKLAVSDAGMHEFIDEICEREVISAHPDSGFIDGDRVLVKEADLVSRWIDKNEISVVFEQDILIRL